MQERLKFILKRIEKGPLMTKEPDQIFKQPPRVVYNFDFEKEAILLITNFHFQFNRTRELCWALAELYRLGIYQNFSGIRVPVNLSRAAYWILQAASLRSFAAFMFLYRMVPEYFIDHTNHLDMIDYVKEALVEQARFVKPGETVQERLKREVCDDLIADFLIYPDHIDILSEIDRIKQYCEVIEKEYPVEPHQASSAKKD